MRHTTIAALNRYIKQPANFRVRYLLAGIALAAFIHIAASASAATITLQQGLNSYVHQDAFVRADVTSAGMSNAGAANNSSRTLAGSVGAPSNPTGPLRAIFSFPLTDIPVGSTINSVQFRIGSDPDTGTSSNADFTAELRTISTSFNEATATWNNTFASGMTMGGTVLSSTLINPEGALTVRTFATSPDLVAAMQSAVDASQPFNFAVVAQAAVETGAARVVFRMGSNTSTAVETLRPTLDIDYTPPVPEPCATTLALIALCCSLPGLRSARA
jgi:hypothetical protein